MTFEEEKMVAALATLKATEKKCCAALYNPPPPAPSSFGIAGGSSSGSGLPISPSFSSLQSMKSRVQGLLGSSGSAEDKKSVRAKQMRSKHANSSRKIETWPGRTSISLLNKAAKSIRSRKLYTRMNTFRVVEPFCQMDVRFFLWSPFLLQPTVCSLRLD